MSILGLSSEEFAHEMNRRRCKGIIASYIARAKQPLHTVSKTLKTYVTRGYVSREQLNDILSLVEIETVRPFRDQTRLARYNDLTSLLNNLASYRMIVYPCEPRSCKGE